MSIRARGAVGLVLVAVGLLVASACTGVPTSSRPQAVQSIGLGENASSVPPRPPRDLDPRTLLTDFVAVNGVAADQNFSPARQYMSKQGSQAWSSSTATVINNNFYVSKWDAQTGELSVEGGLIGTINSAGEYTPSYYGVGDGAPQTFRYRIQLVGGQYRITSAYPGLLLTTDQFRQTFQQRVLYYPGTASGLVPELRYSALTQPARVAEWMLNQLVSPSPDVQAATSTTFPSQTQRVQVSDDGDTAQVQIAGSAALPGPTRDLLAAQVSSTLDGVLTASTVEIDDGRRPVSIPQVGGVQFRASDFAAMRGPTAPTPALYYLAPPAYHIHTSTGLPLTGAVSRSGFSSIALARSASTGQLMIAGVQATTPRVGVLAVGTQAGGVRPTAVRGALARPAWAPGHAEVWTAVGTTVYRVTTDGRSASVARVAVQFQFQAGRVAALRFSPDGSRIAMVITGASNSGQLFVGPVLRSGASVQIGKLSAVSPEGVTVSDVGWSDPEKLIVVGDIASSGSPHVFTSYLDGSGWTAGTTTGLPGKADAVTIANGVPAWVSADGDVWEQGTTGWASPQRSGQTAGIAPVYLE